MQDLLLKYLVTHGSVSLKGWGRMQLVNTSARVDFPNKQIHGPGFSVQFFNQAADDASFTDWLMQQQQLPSQQVQEQIHTFINHFQQLTEKNSIEWSGWGRFINTGSGLKFEADTTAYLQQKAIAAEKIIRSGASHQVLVGNEEHTNLQMEELLNRTSTKQKYSRLLPVLFLAVTGIILAVLFAKNHNIQWKNYTNFQPLQPKEPPVLHKTP